MAELPAMKSARPSATPSSSSSAATDVSPSVTTALPVISPPDRWSSARASLCSACFGAAGSVCAKYGLDDAWTNYFVATVQSAWEETRSRSVAFDTFAVRALESQVDWSWLLFWILRVSFVLAQLYLNTRMLHHFVRSMRASTSLLATTYNQCFLLALSGVAGYLCFRETLTIAWITGVALIAVGVICVQWGQADESHVEGVENSVPATITRVEPETSQLASHTEKSAAELPSHTNARS